MAIQLRDKSTCKYDQISLGEVMLRLDPGEGRIRTARNFQVWEGGGEYNTSRGLRKAFGLKTAVVTAFVDNEVGHLVEDFIMQGGVATDFIKWREDDGTVRPMPSSSRHLMKSVATPPCMMKSSTRWPTSLSTNAVTTAVFRPNALRRPRDVLYSPPPSQTWKFRAVRMRPSPGSRRSMTSPREIWSKAQELAGLMVRLMEKRRRDSAGRRDRWVNH